MSLVLLDPWLRSAAVLLAYMLLRLFTKLYMPAPFDLYVFDIPYATDSPGAVSKREMVELLLTSHASRDPLIALLSMAAVIVLLFVGNIFLRLGRTVKYLVLYLRRFGYTAGTRQISDAARRTLGSHFRVLTLDDGEFTPSGGPPLQTIVAATWAPLAVLVVAGFATGAFALRNVFFQPDDWNPAIRMSDRGFYGPALFRGFSEGVALAWVWLSVYVWWIGHLVWRAAQKRRFVAASADVLNLERWLAAVRARHRRSRLAAPQTVVATTSHDMWKSTVECVVPRVDAVLVDVSVPSESLIWELRKLKELQCGSAVYVADESRIETWCRAADEGIDPQASAMRTELSGRDVLFYRAGAAHDPAFAQALADALRDAARRVRARHARTPGRGARFLSYLGRAMPTAIGRFAMAWLVIPFVVAATLMVPIVVFKKPLRAALESVFRYFV